ncbi:homoserine kinase [Leptospira sp. 96542]|nr:homoserine kinase [Leptospira sp. 96542]
MVRLPKYSISVPGTSANLGPGFDLMGMALEIRNEFSFSFSSEIKSFVSTQRNGDVLPFSDKDDLVQASYLSYFQKFAPNLDPPYYECKMDLNLPLKGGLGSSASAIVAGLVLAREVHKRILPNSQKPNESEFLQFLAEYEGHPDNTLPAYLGGFVFAYSIHGEPIRYFRKKFPGSVAVFVITPEFFVSTEESRKTLPKQYIASDMIFNLSRIGAWMHFLDKRKFGDLLIGLQDKMHTPYRISENSPLYPLTKILQNDRLGFCLSGSGPSLLVFMERKNVKSKLPTLESDIANCLNAENIKYKLTRVKADHLGVVVKIK